MTQDHDDSTRAILRSLHRLESRVNEITPAGVPRLLTIEQTAETLSVSTDTVRRLLDRRELGYVQSRPGAAKRIPTDSLQRWIDTHTTQAV